MNFFQKIVKFFQKNHIISKITRFQKITLFQKSRDFKNHAISKITRFQKSHYFKNHAISKITLFQKSRDFKNHAILKITLFQSHRPCLQNHAIFYHSLLFLKLPCFKKKFPVKVHFGIPRLTICKKAVFSLQDLGFRL